MLDKDLTIESGRREIGESIQDSQLIITKESPFTQIFRAIRRRFDELFKESKIYTDVNGAFGGVHAHPYYSWSGEVEREIRALMLGMDKAYSDIRCALLVKKCIYPLETLEFRIAFLEAVLNAVEHGTNFCETGNVHLKITNGQRGTLGLITQSTSGLTREQGERALLACPSSRELCYERRPGEIRGMGLGRYRDLNLVRVWFNFYGEDLPRFSVIVLEIYRDLFSGDFDCTQ